MTTNRLNLYLAVIAAILALAGLSRAQTEDVFAFIPPGGKTLLMQLAESEPPAEEMRALLSGTRSGDEWLAYLRGRTPALPALGDLGEHELVTLAEYLASNMPLPAKSVPADPARANWNKILPPDGRDLALQNCQFCHIITVVVTQDKTEDAWLGTLNKPSHVEIELTAAQRRALARYLVLNGAIPIDLVPEDLRAGGASY